MDVCKTQHPTLHTTHDFLFFLFFTYSFQEHTKPLQKWTTEQESKRQQNYKSATWRALVLKPDTSSKKQFLKTARDQHRGWQSN